MLTVKWVNHLIGYQEVFECKRVYFRQNNSVPGQVCSDGPTVVGMEFMNGEVLTYDSGDFYVMNDNGKTVADYHLGTSVVEGGDELPRR